jgi:hypothetical protein
MTSFLESSYSIVAQDSGPQPTVNELRTALEKYANIFKKWKKRGTFAYSYCAEVTMSRRLR